MKYEYKSKFAEDIIRMMEFKQSIGHSLDSYEGNMHRLDTFFLSHYPENDSLTQEMVFVWCKIENPENKSPNICYLLVSPHMFYLLNYHANIELIYRAS